ncbi:hypothetical protein NDI56_20815 [Haloarcula sp. S1CR25-12]|uniref:Uncharacterized protein n=1 Tax=Haloarcula saliterrae TaxID=2950534 RepID=A0ABU2FJ41_9EURY|nr:hypothetical protein [Haloarcula sp. S1CR25-12]MDS0261850.1 hypothetical protein [Haloarcula sp. S1CR25-12]
MTMNGKDDAKQLRNRLEDDLDSAYWGLKQRINDGKPIYSNYRSLFQKWWRFGNCSVLLGEVHRAREEYATAGLYARSMRQEAVDCWDDLSKSHRMGFGFNLKWCLYITTLAGDSRLLDALTDDLLEMADRFEADYGVGSGSNRNYWKLSTLAHLCQGNDSKAKMYLDKYVCDNDKQETELLSNLHESLLENDEAATRESLQQLADAHNDRLSNAHTWKAVFSHATAAHLLVARHREIEISAAELKGGFVPEAFDKYDIGTDIDLPEPKYVDESLLLD